ncbi:MAG: glycosyltransferase, partial [Alphaproteobacteria bacterium]|nr:glycosyltransferase [Alphaproteobacteria bacterium]
MWRPKPNEPLAAPLGPALRPPARPLFHPSIVWSIFRSLRNHGLRTTLDRVSFRLNPRPAYAFWIERNETLRRRDRAAIAAHMARFSWRPQIALVMPIGADPPPFLTETIASVAAQLYPHWRLCIAVGEAADTATGTVLAEQARTEPRIVVGGGAGAADFVARLEPGDLLAPHALYLVAAELNAYRDAAIVYSDEDSLNDERRRCDPCFKPDWNPALFETQHYHGRLTAYRAAPPIDRSAVFRQVAEGTEYALALRLAAGAAAGGIRHIPHILYHAQRRPHADRTDGRAMVALQAHLDAAGERAEVVAGPLPGIWRVKRTLPQRPPRVTLIVPTRDRRELLRPCIEGLLNRTRYPDFEVIVVDNESRDPVTLAYLDVLRASGRVRIMRVPGEFDFSALNNRAAAAATGELLGLVNNDIDVIDPDWLGEMVSQALQQGVAAVGAKLRYADDTIQHAGVV